MKNRKNTRYRIDQEFFPGFTKVFQCGEVCTIQDHKEVSIKWDIYSAVIYSFILSRYVYFNNLQMTHEYIAANCNCSIDVVKSRVKLMESIGIVTISRGKTFGGTYKSNRYKLVKDITQDPSFKLKWSKFQKAYQKTLSNRKERLKLLLGIVVDSKWSPSQVRNFIHNRNYELVTGQYLEGDKLNDKLYLKAYTGVNKEEEPPRHDFSQGFKPTDELKQYELEQIEKELIKEDK